MRFLDCGGAGVGYLAEIVGVAVHLAGLEIGVGRAPDAQVDQGQARQVVRNSCESDSRARTRGTSSFQASASGTARRSAVVPGRLSEEHSRKVPS